MPGGNQDKEKKTQRRAVARRPANRSLGQKVWVGYNAVEQDQQ
jgi:hypothetical protein